MSCLLQRAKQRDGEVKERGRVKPFYKCRWVDCSEPSSRLPYRLCSDEEEMRDGCGKVKKESRMERWSTDCDKKRSLKWVFSLLRTDEVEKWLD